jgi:ubiquinone/menaquinone biosynthesis C-methylase UbiE
MSHQHSVQAHLGVAASDYDRIIRTFIPGYEQMLETICWWLSKVIRQGGNIIELGGGTGALAHAVLTKMPKVRMEIWDIDANMLAVAAERLQEFSARLTLREKSFVERLDQCDAVIATLSLHHIPTLEAKRAVYQNISEALTSPGIFLNGDCTIDATEPARGVIVRYWLDFMAMHGISEEEGRKHLDAWSKEDTYQQIYDELAALAQARFHRPEVFWKQGPFTVYGGIKAPR